MSYLEHHLFNLNGSVQVKTKVNQQGKKIKVIKISKKKHKQDAKEEENTKNLKLILEGIKEKVSSNIKLNEVKKQQAVESF